MWRIFVYFLAIIGSLALNLIGLALELESLESLGVGGLFGCALTGLLAARICFDYMLLEGKPITVGKLEKRFYYSVFGTMDTTLDGFCQVVLVDHPLRGIQALKLQKKLPDGTTGFYVVTHVDHLNTEVEGMVDLVICHPRCAGYPKITINLDTKADQPQPEDEDPKDNVIPIEDE